MLEVEIKSRCADLAKIKDAIVKLGAKYVASYIERDFYFNHPSRDFGQTDEALRIRVVNGECYLTYKGPKRGLITKTRYEREVKIDDEKAMHEILYKLGFVLYGEVEKRRDVYKLDEITICCDNVTNLGTFIELETIDDDQKRAEDKLFAIASKLGLEDFISASYLELLKMKEATR